MAVANVVSALQQRGAHVDVAAHHYFDFHGAEVVKWLRVNPRAYSCMAFVCGPLPEDLYFKILFSRFRRTRRAAVGISVINEERPAMRLFDRIVARDGRSEQYFDLAYSELPEESVSVRRRHVGVCLRGHQSEYGDAECAAKRLDDMLTDVARRFDAPAQLISTIVTPENSPERIHQLFAEAKLVLTTRLHGALLALQHRVPFVAIDQICGGRKVKALVDKLQWPYLFAADVDAQTVEAACRSLMNDSGIDISLNETSRKAQRFSAEAIAKAADSILLA
jgi:hypothetical protein